MSTMSMSLPSGKEIQITFPDNLAGTAMNAMIPEIVRVAAAVIAKSGGNIVSATVASYEETKAKIVFYQEYGNVLREEVIPVVAKAKAFQDGRDILEKMGLDRDILDDSNSDLNQRRRGG